MQIVKKKLQLIADLKDKIKWGTELTQRPVTTKQAVIQLYHDEKHWERYIINTFQHHFIPHEDIIQQFEKFGSPEHARLAAMLKNIYVHDRAVFECHKIINNNIEWIQEQLKMIPYFTEEVIVEMSFKDENIDIPPQNDTRMKNKCFIIHGHDDKTKNEVARFIEKRLKKDSIILHEQASEGKTIIEKFERHSDVDFAVAIWTADDLGQPKGEANSRLRARQNVIYETGYFAGKLGRGRVVILREQGVEIPTDLLGVIYIDLAESWEEKLRQEVEAIYTQQ